MTCEPAAPARRRRLSAALWFHVESDVWFVPLQPLWRVERTFAWLGRNRRLRHDYEATVTSSQTFVHTAAVAFMLTWLNPNR